MLQLQQTLSQTFNPEIRKRGKQVFIATTVTLTLFANMAHAVILSDSTSRRNQPSANSYSSQYQQNNTPDRLAQLIEQKSQQYQKNADSFYRSQQYNNNSSTSNNSNSNSYTQNSYSKQSNSQHYPYDGHDHSSAGFANWQVEGSYKKWINNPYNRHQASEYQRFLQQHVGANNVPNLSQLLQTARSWQRCGAEQFEVPPKNLWGNMVSTLFLLTELKRQGIIPRDITIRSVYRNTRLNRCAGGANGSKHKINAAMDLWMPQFDYDAQYRYNIQDKLCDFWLFQGRQYKFGLGIYSSGAIHIDTDGYRKWGSSHSSASSPCRY